MAILLELPNGSGGIAPELIKVVLPVPNKGVVLRNEYNKIISMIPETDAERHKVIVKVVKAVVDKGEDWHQPNWDAEFAKIPAKPKAPAKGDKAD